METHERQLVLEQLASSETRLLELLNELTQEQWEFRETPERWSIAENIEHVIVLESFIQAAIRRVLEGPTEPEKRPLAAGKEPLVLGLAESRSNKINARESVRPVGRWPNPAELITELRKSRAQTMAFAA